MSQTNLDRDNSRRVRTHEKNSGETVRRLGTIIQSTFCAQSGASIRLNSWKFLGENRYTGAFSHVLENFRPVLSPDPTDCPRVSEDGINRERWDIMNLWVELYLFTYYFQEKFTLSKLFETMHFKKRSNGFHFYFR